MVECASCSKFTCKKVRRRWHGYWIKKYECREKLKIFIRGNADQLLLVPLLFKEKIPLNFQIMNPFLKLTSEKNGRATPSRMTQSKSYKLSSNEYASELKNNALWDTH